MFYRQVCFSLLSSVFLFGAVHSLLAGSCVSSAEEDSRGHSALRLQLTEEDKENFAKIEAARNPVLRTNVELDRAQHLLTAPLIAEISLEKYLMLKNPKNKGGANPSLFIGLLDNNTKVFIKRSIKYQIDDDEPFLYYELEQAIAELGAPRMARDYFDVPTLPPTELVYENEEKFELRQYLIDDALPENKVREKHFKMLSRKPQLLNRPPLFINDLILFDCFIGADDRNPTNLMWVPCKNLDSPLQYDFFAIDYAETNGRILKKPQYFLHPSEKLKATIKEREEEVMLPPSVVTPSSLVKLQRIFEHFETYFGDVRHLFSETPYTLGDSKVYTPGDMQLYTPQYFPSMKIWQQALIDFYDPITGKRSLASSGISL